MMLPKDDDSWSVRTNISGKAVDCEFSLLSQCPLAADKKLPPQCVLLTYKFFMCVGNGVQTVLLIWLLNTVLFSGREESIGGKTFSQQ